MDAALKSWEKNHKKYLEPPKTAWPTTILFFVSFSIFCTSCYAGIQAMIPIYWCIPINAITQFMLFTVLHDASHRALSQRSWLNESLGFISALIISPLGGIRLFRFVHMQHHRFTNEDGDHDPDSWCGKGRVWTLPLRWVTLDVHYLLWYGQRWHGRPVKEKLELLLSSSAVATLIVIFSYQGHFMWLFWLWLVPSRLSTTWLALAFDYLPHYPHDVMGKDQPMRATSIKPGLSWLMTPLFLCQNYHLIHHLYPRIPFYRYPGVWKQAKTELIAAEARVMSWGNRELTL